jgi:putative ABC transport system substrate-binding protein
MPEGIADLRLTVKRIATVAATSFLLSAAATTLAQSPERKVHIGILVGGSLTQRGHLEQALLQGLREQGYVEGKNLVLERRYANGNGEQTPVFARELARMKPLWARSKHRVKHKGPVRRDSRADGLTAA